MKLLDKIFKELEDEAIPPEWYAYEIKRTNQIIRANVEPLEQQITELENALLKVQDSMEIEVRGIKQVLK